MERYRILLLGLGFWGTNWMRTLTKIENCEVAAIATGPRTIGKVSAEYGLPEDRAYRDYREAIERTDADIIIAIPTPYHTHAAHGT